VPSRVPARWLTRPHGTGTTQRPLLRDDRVVDEDDRVVDEDVAAALRSAWAHELERIAAGSTWVDKSLRPILAAAADDPDLRSLFPFTSMNRLCFSRCSAYPYTFDCPCIAADRGHYSVLATWAVSDEPAPILAEADEAAEAVSVVVRHLPDDRRVWIGTAE
jgi:hypothetical protein